MKIVLEDSRGQKAILDVFEALLGYVLLASVGSTERELLDVFDFYVNAVFPTVKVYHGHTHNRYTVPSSPHNLETSIYLDL